VISLVDADGLPSLPGLTRQSIVLNEVFVSMDARVKPAHDEFQRELLGRNN